MILETVGDIWCARVCVCVCACACVGECVCRGVGGPVWYRIIFCYWGGACLLAISWKMYEIIFVENTSDSRLATEIVYFDTIHNKTFSFQVCIVLNIWICIHQNIVNSYYLKYFWRVLQISRIHLLSTFRFIGEKLSDLVNLDHTVNSRYLMVLLPPKNS